MDKEYGHEITKCTSDEYRSWHLYFNVESFIDEDNAIIYSNRSGVVNLFRLNFTDGTMTQMTDETENVGGNIWYIQKDKTVWYKVGNSIHSINTETFESKIVLKMDSLRIESFAVTSDGKYFAFATNKNHGFSDNCSTGPFTIFCYGLEDKSMKQISPDYGFIISHVQTSPTNPNIVTYVWQHRYRVGSDGIVGNTPQRIWWVNIEGTDGGPVGNQEFGINRTHEFWYYDGSRIGFLPRYKFGPKLGK